MNFFLTLALSLAAFFGSICSGEAATDFSKEQGYMHFCYLPGKRYAFLLSNDLYEKMTSWNIQSSEPPPVSPQKAYKLAKARLDKISIPEGYYWTFQAAWLQPVSEFS
jgi:hypothetical protein